MTMTHMMLAARYKELDEELAQARQRVAELLDAWEGAHEEYIVRRSGNQGAYAINYNKAEGSIENKKQEVTAALADDYVEEAMAKAKADILRARLDAARDDVKVVLQQMTNAQSVGAFAREEMKL